MGKIVMPKNSALLNEIEAVLKIYYEAGDWLPNEEYKNKLKAMIGDEQYSSSYTKKAQITSYFGFTISRDLHTKRITPSGYLMYESIQKKDISKIQDVLMEALETVKFGRDNDGCPESQSDVDPPSLFIRAIMDLGYLTYKEFAYLLWKLEDVGGNYTDSLYDIKKFRTAGQINIEKEAQKYTDAKPIMILIRWGFLKEDDDSSGSGGRHIIIEPAVQARFENRLKALKIYNIDKLNLNYSAIVTNFKQNTHINFKTGFYSKFKANRIIFGAPGTGKSYSINLDRKKLLGDINETDYERVTFHPDYSYANFVGTYKPVMVDYSSVQTIDEEIKTNLEILKDPNKSAQEKYDFFYDNGQDIGLTRIPILIGITTDEPFHTKKSAGDDAANDNIVERNHGIALRKYVQLKGENSDIKASEISYEYVPGPFMRMYVKALENAQKVAKGEEEPRPFLLIIEEINRANVAAVFGDVFQLLDRKDNVSEYPIQASEDIKKYLAEKLGGDPENYSKIKIPDNMFIWATMNSADQGVFPMDTAFKRRWDFTYLGIDDNDEELKDKFVSMIHHGEQKFVEWNSLRMAINEFLANEKINEDKQLGPYFIAKDIVVPATGNEIDKDKFNDVFKHKVLMYLFDDAAKQKRSKLFEGIPAESSRYSKICKAFEEKGVDIFHTSIRDTVITRGYLHEAKEPEHLNETEDWKESDA